MKQVSSLVRVGRRKLFVTTVLGTLVAAAAAQGVASAQTRETAVRTLGGPNRFSGPMHSADDLKAMINANRTPVTSALGQAGLGDMSDKFLDTVNGSPGTHFDWMALKRAGRPGVLRNVRWTGRDAFDAFQFSVEYNGYNYTFIVPKICGNFALLSRTAVVAAAPPPAPAPPPPPPEPVAPPPPPPAPTPIAAVSERTYPWMVTGFLGSQWNATGTVPNFATNESSGGLTFGGQIGYLRRYVGGEFIADFGPTYRLSSLALTQRPWLNSWMGNAIGAFPFGSEENFQVFGSGGIGAITIRASTFTLAGTNTVFLGQNTSLVALDTVNNTQSKFAYNVGGGFFAYVASWGIRGDIRYYRATTFEQAKLENGPTQAIDYTQSLISGLRYWRANLGVAYRW
jgi:hypothetical protein